MSLSVLKHCSLSHYRWFNGVNGQSLPLFTTSRMYLVVSEAHCQDKQGDMNDAVTALLRCPTEEHTLEAGDSYHINLQLWTGAIR
jgi:hypothetical protein